MKPYPLFLFVATLAGASLTSSYESYAQAPAKATIIELNGQVRFKNPSDAEWKSAAKGTELYQGAQIFVGESSECQLILGSDSKSITKLKQETRATLTSLGNDARIDVSSGEVFSLFKRLGNTQSTFRVASPTAIASVRGTVFSFAAEGIGSEVSNTLEVYEKTVGLSPLLTPDKEIEVGEGHGVVMGADGVVEKQFELSVEDMRVAQEFTQQAAEVLSLDKSGPENVPSSESRTDAPKTEDDDQIVQGGPPPPGSPPPGGPTDGPGGQGSSVDSAIDGVVMGMARDSELSHSQVFSGDTLNHDVANLAELGIGAGASTGHIDPGLLADTVRTAVTQSDYFQSQPPEVQQQISAHMDTYFENYAQRFEEGAPIDATGGLQPAFEGPAGMDPSAFNVGTYDPFRAGMDTSGLINPNDLASFINERNFRPDELQSIINFILKIREDYNAHKLANGGSDSTYYGSQRTITNFNFVKDGVNYTGSILFTPVAVADPNPSFGAHSHAGPDFLHLTNVVVKDDPTGAGGNVLVSPSADAGGTLEVPTA